MCIKSQTCLCHYLKPVIRNDKKQQLRSDFFAPRYMDELYDFLSESYKLIDNSNDISRFDKRLYHLVETYIKPQSEKEINLNNEEYREQFIAAYEELLDYTSDVNKVMKKLSTLVDDVQIFVYVNLSNSPDFRDYLSKQQTKNRETGFESSSHSPKEGPMI